MNSRLRKLGSALLWSLAAAPVAAQSIALKTVPIPTGEQFLIFPSRSLGMGELSVAHDDPLRDLFGNPARGSRLTGTWMVAAPAAYGSNLDNVGGATLPLTVAHGGKRWFGGFGAAIQQLDSPEQQWFWWVNQQLPPGDQVLLDDEAANTYLHGTLGRRLGERTALGVSGYYAELSAIDGVGQLYANSISIAQSGTLYDIRAGVVHELDGERRLEGTIGNSLLDMTHDVVYVNWPTWTSPPSPTPPQPTIRTEQNRDRTATWAAQLRYTAPLEGNARFGALLVANTKSHPKIPNYEIVNIPRDPGNSTLFAAGVGVSTREGPNVYGVELLLQPGRSHTWAFADADTVTPAGTVRKGEKTVDNEFRFRNWSLAMGWEREWSQTGLQFGLRVNRYGYDLEQMNFLTRTYRDTDESWIEWSPSWGGLLKLGRGELRYAGRFVAKGFDGLDIFPVTREDASAAPSPGGSDFLVAPTGPVNLPDFRVTLHQLMLVVPLSGGR